MQLCSCCLTSDTPTCAPLPPLSCLQQLVITQVTINIFTNVQPAGFPGSEAPTWLNVQYTLTTKWFQPGTSVATAAPTPTAVALQPSVQWTDSVNNIDFLYGMCLIEDTLLAMRALSHILIKLT